MVFYPILMLLSLIEGMWLLCVGLGARKLAPVETRKKTGFLIFSIFYGFIAPIILMWGSVAYFLNIVASEGAAGSNPIVFLCTLQDI